MVFASCKCSVQFWEFCHLGKSCCRLDCKNPQFWVHAGYAVKEGKKHAGPQPQKWFRVAAQAKGTFQKGQGCQCCSAANMTATSNAKTCVPPAAVYRTLGATPGTPRYQSWLTSALCKATPGKAARLAFASGNVKTSFCEWQRWFLGSGAMFARAYPHTSRGSSIKLAIRIGLAAKLLSMCSKATKHGVAFRIGLAAKLLRMRSKATKDDFAIRIGSAAKLLRKCFKE